AMIAQRTDNGQVVSLLGQVGQVFTEINSWRAGCDGLERTAILRGSMRLHVPRIDVRRPAAEPNHDGGPSDFSSSADGRCGPFSSRVSQVEPEHAQAAGHEKGATI